MSADAGRRMRAGLFTTHTRTGCCNGQARLSIPERRVVLNIASNQRQAKDDYSRAQRRSFFSRQYHHHPSNHQASVLREIILCVFDCKRHCEERTRNPHQETWRQRKVDKTRGKKMASSSGKEACLAEFRVHFQNMTADEFADAWNKYDKDGRWLPRCHFFRVSPFFFFHSRLTVCS